jgi:tetratricopeptide (TPR) repeat protein
MSSISGDDEAQKPKLLGFLILLVLAAAMAVYALFFGGEGGHAPMTAHVDDWVGWARVDMTDAGFLAVAVVMALIAVIGALVALAGGGKPARPARKKRREATRYDDPFDHSTVSMTETVAPAAPIEPETFAKSDSRGGSLKFEAPAETAVPVAVIAEPAAFHEITSLEPAVFHDNASDSFLSQVPVTPEPHTEPVNAVFEPDAALSDTHGLHVKAGAEVIPIRPDISNPALAAAQAPEAHDPVEAALLAETPPVIQTAPQSDLNAVISSAMSFIGAPEPEPASPEPAIVAPAVEAVAAPVEIPAQPAAAADDQAEIRQAVQTALSVWPDNTRAIAAGEVGGRIAHLYYSRAPEDSRAFHLIAQGDLSAAAAALQSRAEALAAQGFNAEAAEQWRIYGALHMGRDDPKAMMAYEHVSALDLSDANIHLYLARRYAMANDTAKQPAVLGRALAVISDPATRVELLSPYADLKLKAEDYKAAGDAFEELARLQEQASAAQPGNIQAKSAYAVAFARAAQARELGQDFGRAGPLYRKAAQTFADLSAQVPDHAGLRAMADNAARDAQRFSVA